MGTTFVMAVKKVVSNTAIFITARFGINLTIQYNVPNATKVT